MWASLERRPLHLPALAPGAACPLVPTRQISPQYGPALGDGPVYALGFGTDSSLPAVDAAHFGTGASKWGGMKVVWVMAPGNNGAVIARGRQIDGSHALRFNGGLDQQNYQGDWTVATLLPELRLVWLDQAGAWDSYVRLQAPGCYAMQVDGLSFSEILVFQAVVGA